MTIPHLPVDFKHSIWPGCGATNARFIDLPRRQRYTTREGFPSAYQSWLLIARDRLAHHTRILGANEDCLSVLTGTC